MEPFSALIDVSTSVLILKREPLRTLALVRSINVVASVRADVIAL